MTENENNNNNNDDEIESEIETEIKELNDSLDKMIDETKSFEEQIKLF